MNVKISDIKNLREATGAGIADCRQALEKSEGSMDKAKEILRKKGIEKARKKAGREVRDGLVVSYIHAGGKVGSLVEVSCETDFVAKTDDFKALAKEIAMQVTAMDPKSVDELMEQVYIRDSSKKIKDLVTEVISKTGENIKITNIARFAVGR